MVASDEDDSSELSPRVVHNHYSQSKNSSGVSGSTLNTILLACLIAIVGFVGAKVWQMSSDVSAMQNTLTLIVEGRIRIPTQP